MNRVVLLIAAASLAGCDATVDTSDPQAYVASVTKVMKELSPDQKTEFQQAMVAIAFDTPDPSTGIFSQANPVAPIFLAAGDKIDGKSATEIIRLGYESRIAGLDKAIAEDMAAIQRVKAAREKHKAVFDSIHIDGAKYYISESSFIAEPVISFTITNGAKIPLRRIYLAGVLSSPGRSIPWVSSDINYKFSGGLEPGESERLDLSPNMFGEWKIDDRYSRRPDLNLKLNLVNIEGSDGTPLIADEPGDAAEKQVDAAAKQKQRNELQDKLQKLTA